MSMLMAGRVSVLSPAKINLHLEVYPRRDDGYHDLLSVFQSVSLFDEMEARSLKSKDVCTIEGDFDFPPEKNIVWTCCELFRRETGFSGGVGFIVKKRIPEGAGLGGGSSNAAAALRALNVLSGAGLPDEGLARLGARAGSDVPFFCREAAALVSGRGDLIRGLRPRTDFSLLLVVPAVRVATRDAYGWLDAAAACATPDKSRSRTIVRSYLDDPPATWGFFNSFYPVLCGREPVFERIREELAAEGAAFASLSGSGSAMFGVFTDERKAVRAREVMAERYAAAEHVVPLAAVPDAILQ